jgi:tRNA pseudouridine55 synthase
MDGLIPVRKPSGCTSHDVVARLRRILGQKKIGHFGTLDPLATGLLLAAAGKATRFFPFYGKRDKSYDGRIRFGFATDTYDSEGRPTTDETDRYPLVSEARSAMKALVGELLQRPPVFSAKKVKGQPMYAHARRGTPVESAAVSVTVTVFELRSYAPPFLDFRVDCSSGTYIRSLAHDLGAALGCGGHLAALKRTRIGEFSLDAAPGLEEIQGFMERGEPDRFLIPMEALLPEWPGFVLTPEGALRMKDGRPVGPEHFADPPADRALQPDSQAVARLFGPEGKLLALAHPAPRPALFAPFLVLL